MNSDILKINEKVVYSTNPRSCTFGIITAITNFKVSIKWEDENYVMDHSLWRVGKDIFKLGS